MHTPATQTVTLPSQAVAAELSAVPPGQQTVCNPSVISPGKNTAQNTMEIQREQG